MKCDPTCVFGLANTFSCVSASVQVHLFTRANEMGGSHSVVDGVHVHKVPIELDSDFVNECNNMCNAFAYFLRETESFMQQSFDIIHCHDWLAAKALVQLKVYVCSVSVPPLCLSASLPLCLHLQMCISATLWQES